MSDNNPFQPPQSDIEVKKTGSSHQMADRGQRLGASIIDTLIGLSIMLPIMYFMGFFEYISASTEPPFSLIAFTSFFGFVVYIGIHYYFIKQNGQTIGKKILNIRIENRDGSVASFNTIIFKRYLFMTVISLIPVIGSVLSIINILAIFRKSRYCFHDDVALTQVAKCQ